MKYVDILDAARKVTSNESFKEFKQMLDVSEDKEVTENYQRLENIALRANFIHIEGRSPGY